MSNAGHHAADDGSLARSTGGAAARGAMLIALALAIGLLLMAFALDDPATEIVAGGTDSAETDEGATDDPGDGAATDDAGAGDDEADDPGVTLGEPDDTPDSTPETIPEIDETESVPPPLDGEFFPPNEVNVLVANGTGGRGVAGGTADKLIADGYTANASNAPATDAGVVFYKPGYSENARNVAEILNAAPDVVQPIPEGGQIGVSQEAIADGRLDAANIIVIVGNDGAVPPPA